MTKVQQTSIDAFHSLNDLGGRQLEVFLAIKKLKVCNNREIADFLKMPINQITPRCAELRGMKLVEEAGTKVDLVTKKTTLLWKIK